MKNQNILIVTDVFTDGGLETQIIGAFKVLKKLGYNLYLITGKEYIAENFPKELLTEEYTGFPFSSEITALEIIAAKDFIVQLIKKHDIDVVHCHPFVSLVPAFIAAQETQRPFVYSFHGPASLGGYLGPLYEFLLKSIVLPSASIIHCVSRETQALVQHFVPTRTHVWPNGVDVNVFTDTMLNRETGEIKKCCIVSRLDIFKTTSIIFFIELASSAGIKQIDIIGDGVDKQKLIEWVAERADNLPQIQFLGYQSNVAQLLHEYDLVAGMGRVVLEAAAANIPVVLAGYDGIKGLVDEHLLNTASFWNYSGRGISNIQEHSFLEQLEELRTSPQKYRLRNWILQHASEEKIWSDFSTRLQKITYHESEFVATFVNCLQWSGAETVPIFRDDNFLQLIKDVLRSDKYIMSPYHQIMSEFEHRQYYSSLKNNFDTSLQFLNVIHENTNLFVTKQKAEADCIEHLNTKLSQDNLQIVEKINTFSDDINIKLKGLQTAVEENNNLLKKLARKDSQIQRLQKQVVEWFQNKYRKKHE